MEGAGRALRPRIPPSRATCCHVAPIYLNVVVGDSAAVLELLVREDEAMDAGGDALLVLDLALHHVDAS